MEKIRVLLADDHPMVRRGIRNLLEQESDIHVVGEASNGREALQMVEDLGPDIVLLDIQMPDLTGIEVARRLHTARSPVHILALSAYADRQYALRMLANGAAGYLTKEEAPKTIVQAIRGIYRGEDGWLSRRVALELVASAQEGQPDKASLTEREMDTLRLTLLGKTDEQIGKTLHIDQAAVKEELQTLLPKLGGSTRMEAAMRTVHKELVGGMLASIRVLIVDDIRLMCNMMADFLEEQPDVKVVGCATSLEEAQSILDQCDMILVNNALPDGGALELVRKVANQDPSIKVLVVGLSEMEPAVLQYIEAGAAGYIPNDDTMEALLEHIRAAHQDAALISPRIASALMSRINELATWMPESRAAISNLDELTPRELEVLRLMGRGLGNKEIAAELFIEAGTVKNHVHNIYKKLDVNNRHDAAAYVSLIDSEPA
jgi:DNA-binding NarL/FixJ family response regulator